MLSSISCAQRNSSAARAVAFVSRQAGKAASAARTAASTSAAVPRGTRASTSPSAGLTTSMVSPLAAGTQSPPISCALSMIRELPARGPGGAMVMSGSSVLVDDHAADVLAVQHVLVALVDLVEPVGPRDQLVELE